MALWEQIDEKQRAVDADAVQSGLIPSNDIFETGLTSLNDPGTGANHIVRYRFRKTPSDAQRQDLVTELVQQVGAASTIVASWTHTDIGTTLSTVTQTLTSAQASTITDYGNLRLRFKATQV